MHDNDRTRAGPDNASPRSRTPGVEATRPIEQRRCGPDSSAQNQRDPPAVQTKQEIKIEIVHPLKACKYPYDYNIKTTFVRKLAGHYCYRVAN